MSERPIIITSEGRNSFVINGKRYAVDVTSEQAIAKFLLDDEEIGEDLVWLFENVDNLFRTYDGAIGLLHMALHYALVESSATQNPKSRYYIAVLWLIRYMGQHPQVYRFEKIVH